MQAPHSNHVVLIGSSARAAAASARSAGLHVTAIDSFADADLRGLCDDYHPLPARGLPVDFLRDRAPSILVPLGGCERRIDAMFSLAGRHRIAAAPADTWREAKRLSRLQAIAQAAGIRFPESHLQAPESDSLSSRPNRWLIKEERSCGGLGVRWWEGVPDRPAHEPNRGPRCVWQRWTEGIPIGVSYLAAGTGVPLLGACQSLGRATRYHPAIYAGSSGPLTLDPQSEARLRKLGEITAQQLQLRGLFNIDLIWHGSKELYLLEINPRYSASMELLEEYRPGLRSGREPTVGAPLDRSPRDRSLIGLHLQCYSASLSSAAPLTLALGAVRSQPTAARCKRVIFAPHDVHFDATLQRCLRAIIDAHSAHWADLPQEDSRIVAGHPLVSIFTIAETTEEAIDKGGQLAMEIENQLPGPKRTGP